MKADQAPLAAADAAVRIDIHEGAEDAAIETHAEMALDGQVDAPSAADREPDLVVAIGRVARQSEQSGQERARASSAEILTATREVLVDHDRDAAPAGQTHPCVR